MNKQEKQTSKNSQTQTTVWWEEVEEGKGGKVVTEGDLVLGGGHTMQYTDDVSQIELYPQNLYNITN